MSPLNIIINYKIIKKSDKNFQLIFLPTIPGKYIVKIFMPYKDENITFETNQLKNQGLKF